jgi:PKD repeat protein
VIWKTKPVGARNRPHPNPLPAYGSTGLAAGRERGLSAPFGGQGKHFSLTAIAIAILLILVQPVRADWQFRRSIEANWDPAQSPPTSIAIADFFTAGHAAADGSDIRVTTADGTLMPSHVLMIGPGDRARVAFALVRPVKQYFVYFGNPTPTMPAGSPELKFDCGLHLEMRELAGDGPFNTFARLTNAWDLGGKLIGKTLIPEANLGFNPFGPQDRTVSRITGSIFAPVDGQYDFSVWADDFAAVAVDGNFIVFGAAGPRDTRNHHAVQLSRGPHAILIYHVNTGGDGVFLVAWKTPNSVKFDPVGRRDIATFHTCNVGALEQNHAPLVADFTAQYMGEAFFADDYSFHYKFTAYAPAVAGAQMDWDFGDGQTASGAQVDHVYLSPGVYPVRLTVRAGNLSDSQTTQFGVNRLWEQIDRPPGEQIEVHARIAASDDLGKLAEPSLCRAVLLFQRAGVIDAMLAAAGRLAALGRHENPDGAFQSLEEATKQGIASGRGGDVVRFWQSVPQDSDLHARSMTELADLLLWRVGDFAAAVRLLKPLADAGDVRMKRNYGQALIFDQKADDGAKILRSLPAGDSWEHHVALSGAMARTIEYYITQRDWAAGEEVWERWQSSFPADFLEGYSVLLRTRLMEIKGDAATAAKVAAAFASAVPTSSYAPQLLDRASRLLSSTDPAQSAALRKLLKDRYPEDPLSQ